MRIRLDEMLREAKSQSRVVPAVTVYSFSTACSVVRAAETLASPVTVLVAPNRFAQADGPRLVKALRLLADDAAVPVSVQLDHAADFALIAGAVEAGADAVMADGSKLAIADNAALVARVVDAFPGIVVEAELGAIAGDEDRAVAAAASGFTDPGAVAGFIEESRSHLLAVSVGNVHGTYRGEPELQWELMKQIAAATSYPLALHGASGLLREDIRRAADYGFAKVNVNTEVREILLSTIEHSLGAVRGAGEDVLALENSIAEAVESFAQELISDLQQPSMAEQ